MRIFVLAALAACGSPPMPVQMISSTAPSGHGTCAVAKPRRSHVALTLETWLGRVGDRSWLIVERDNQHALVTLGDDGTLVTTPLPGTSRDKITTTIEGTHLWFVRDEPGPGNHEVLYDIDLSTSRPAIGSGEPLSAKTLDGSSSFGISATRMLVYSFTGAGPGPGFQLLGEHRAPLATLAYTIYGIDDPPIRCVRDHCFAVTRPDEKGRTFATHEFAPDGTHTIEALTPDDHIMSYALVPDGDRTIVVWDGLDRSGLLARTLDPTGHPIDGEATLTSFKARDAQFVPGPHAELAFRDAQGWAIAIVAPDGRALGEVRRIGFPNASFLTIAQTTDGALAMAFTSHSSIDTLVPPTTASAVFVPTSGTIPPPIDILFGQKRTSWVPFPLVAPGYAAALLLDQSDAGPDGELVILRQPC